ncbi:MFS transporter [Pseudovibrio japonicus]|uniref:MFS transporter n=2 Tax=Pseudovibrio japonicus TaxID=366534 RepID=A0ABQ3DZ14_9HYPH|nr:MFS transporter [Pseudovibrio japonicus]
MTTVIVGMTLLLIQLDGTVLGTAIPTIARDLEIDPLSLHLTISLYQLTLAIFIPMSGWAADRFGSKRLYITAALLFLTMSLACAFSANLTQLLIARSVQGLAGAFLMPIGRLTVIRMAGSKNLVQAMVWVVIPSAFGTALGPFIGGVIVNYLSWRWIFLINVPVCIAAGMMSSFYFRNYKSKDKIPFDFLGFALLGSTAAFLLSGITNLMRFTNDASVPIGFFGASLLCGLAFTWHSKRALHPLIDLKLFENASYRLASMGQIPLRIGVSSFAFVMPLILQILMGYNTLVTGLLMGAAAVGALLSRIVAYRLIKSLGFRGTLIPFIAVLSTLTLATGFVWLTKSIAAVALLSLLIGFSRSVVFTSSNTVSYTNLTRRLVNPGVSFASLVQQLSIALSVGFAAAVLHIFQSITEEPTLSGPDFIWLSILTGSITLLSVALYWLLPAELGKHKLNDEAYMQQ